MKESTRIYLQEHIGENDAEFIEAVSAAISVATGKDNGSFVIKSIKEN